jgi:gas vesicle protein
MAKKKKEKMPWEKLKYVSEHKYKEYEAMDKDQLVAALKVQRAHQLELKKEKAQSGTLKEIRAELKEYRDKWADENPQLVGEIEDCKERIKEIQKERDEEIEQYLEEKKDLEGGFNDSIKGAQEHINVQLDFLRKLG